MVVAAALVFGIRAECAVAAVCDVFEVKKQACGGLFSEEKRTRDRREFCNVEESEKDLLPKGN